MTSTEPSTEASEEFTKPLYENGKFTNPWKSFKDTSGGFSNMLRLMFKTKNYSNIPNQRVGIILTLINFLCLTLKHTLYSQLPCLNYTYTQFTCQ